MSQLYQLPNGKIVVLRDHKTFRLAKWCLKCGCMVSKWHRHYLPDDKDEDPCAD